MSVSIGHAPLPIGDALAVTQLFRHKEEAEGRSRSRRRDGTKKIEGIIIIIIIIIIIVIIKGPLRRCHIYSHLAVCGK